MDTARLLAMPISKVETVQKKISGMAMHERRRQREPGGTPILKGRGYSLKILKRTSKRYQDPVLWAWLKGGAKAPAFDGEHTKRYQN